MTDSGAITEHSVPKPDFAIPKPKNRPGIKNPKVPQIPKLLIEPANASVKIAK